MPFFSSIIPSHNRYHLLKKAINSVLSQNFDDYELIIIDDGSTDNTSAIAEEYPSVVYKRQDNMGVSNARNHGIETAKGRFIAFLDSDDIWLPEKLKFHKHFIDSNPDILIHQTEDIWIRNGRRVNPGKKHIKPEGDIFIPSIDLCLISPSSVMIRNDIFTDCGMFDELLPSCEDYDLWLRITCGHKVGLIREKLIIRYSGHKDQLSARYWGMDRFRVYSILKLLIQKDSVLKPEQKKVLKEKCIEKLSILAAGHEKRGKLTNADSFKSVRESLIVDTYMNTDYQSLLKEWCRG